jgi:hypothetical protein
MEEIAPAKSLAKGLPDLESSHREVFVSTNLFCHLFIIGMVSASL